MALGLFADLTRRAPTPSNLIEYAEQLRAAGRVDAARGTLDLAEASLALLAANGGRDDLSAAALAFARSDVAFAGSGVDGADPGRALTFARREWQRRHHADVADTLSWALHLAGRNVEALRYARLAQAPGARNATYAYHLGMIELSLGHQAAGRAALARAMQLNPYFSPVDAPLAARALAAGGTS